MGTAAQHAVEIDFGFAVDDAGWYGDLPKARLLCRQAVESALRAKPAVGIAEVSVLLTSDADMKQLNERYRGREGPTNVLAFPADGFPSAGGRRILGDIVLARETALREAAAQGKSSADHVAHLVIHGTMHLLGHDHQTEAGAQEMEALETAALGFLGIANPYRSAGDVA